MNPTPERTTLEAQPPVRAPEFPPRTPERPVPGLARLVHAPEFLLLDFVRLVRDPPQPIHGVEFLPPDPEHRVHGPEFLPPGYARRVRGPVWRRTVRINYDITVLSSRNILDFFRESSQANAYFLADGARPGDAAGEGFIDNRGGTAASGSKDAAVPNYAALHASSRRA